MDQTENPAGLEENNKSSSGQEKEQQMSPSQSPRGRSRSPTPLSPPPANSSSLPQEQQQQSSIQNKQSESSSSHNHHHHHHHDESSKNFDKEMEGRSVFVRNLAFRVTKEDLQYELDKVQGVLDIYIPTEYHSKQPRGFAYIEFENAENAKEAQKILDGKDLKGRTVDAEIARGGRKSRDQMKHRYSFDTLFFFVSIKNQLTNFSIEKNQIDLVRTQDIAHQEGEEEAADHSPEALHAAVPEAQHVVHAASHHPQREITETIAEACHLFLHLQATTGTKNIPRHPKDIMDLLHLRHLLPRDTQEIIQDLHLRLDQRCEKNNTRVCEDHEIFKFF